MEAFAGFIELNLSGGKVACEGNFTYNLGGRKRTAKAGPDGVHGWEELPQVPFIEGTLAVLKGLSITDVINGTDETINLTLASSKVIVLGGAIFAGEGTGDSGAGSLAVRWEGARAHEQ